MISTLKGLYWYFKYSERIVFPLSKTGWKVLLGVASSWKYGVPEPLTYGAYVLLSLEDVMTESSYNCANEVIEYQRKRTEMNLASYQVFPTGPWTKIERQAEEELGNYKTLGWKQEYEWKPL